MINPLLLTTLLLLLLLPPTTSTSCQKNPSYTHLSLGNLSLTILSDGQLKFPIPALYRINDLALQRALSADFLPTNPTVLDLNILLIRIKGKIVLMDVGSGVLFQPENTGRLRGNLRSVGVRAEDVDYVLLTHAHPDHLGGLVDENNRPVFKNAEIWIGKKEFDFWTTNPVDLSGSLFTQDLKNLLIQVAQNVLGAVKDNLRFIDEFGTTPFPEIRAVKIPGHTPGHFGFYIRSGSETLFYTGDTIINKPTTINNPEWGLKVATNVTQEIESRFKTLDALAMNRILTLIEHGTWPGLGYVQKFRGAFDWVPAPGMFDFGVRQICYS